MEGTSPEEAGVEWVQARIPVEGLGSAMTEAEVVKAVEAKPGIHSMQIIGNELHVVYDPLRCTEKELEAAIQASGHHPEHGAAERDSPFAEMEPPGPVDS